MGRLGLGAAAPVSASLRGHVDAVLDQGPTQSCVAHAWAQALTIGDRIDGQSLPTLASVLFLYFNSRAWHDEEEIDAGTYLRTCAQGLVRFGRAPDRLWPFDVARVNTRPSWKAYRAAFDLRGPRGYYRIANGDLASVRRALAAGKPVVFGMAVEAAFVDDRGPLVIGDAQGPAIGGHAMCVVGYNGDNFEIVNSWGTGWRNGGFAWLTSGRLATATDLWAVDP
ncbi:MAG: C1 family peptidase [Polyangiaceae bacterium]|nr:C1 family peptidase [Polyangiaceae bacterium]